MDHSTLHALARHLRPGSEGEDGQALVEYALILVICVIACIAVVTTLGGIVDTGLWGLAGSLFPGG